MNAKVQVLEKKICSNKDVLWFPFILDRTWMLFGIFLENKEVLFARGSRYTCLDLSSPRIIEKLVLLKNSLARIGIDINKFANKNIHGDYPPYFCGVLICYVVNKFAKNEMIIGNCHDNESVSTIEAIETLKADIIIQFPVNESVIDLT